MITSMKMQVAWNRILFCFVFPNETKGIKKTVTQMKFVIGPKTNNIPILAGCIRKVDAISFGLIVRVTIVAQLRVFLLKGHLNVASLTGCYNPLLHWLVQEGWGQGRSSSTGYVKFRNVDVSLLIIVNKRLVTKRFIEVSFSIVFLVHSV